MKETPPKPRLLLTALFALWAIAFTYAFVAAGKATEGVFGWSAIRPALPVFLGWQGVAGLVALASFGVSRAWSRGSTVRRLGRVPLGIGALVLFAVVVIVAVMGASP